MELFYKYTQGVILEAKFGNSSEAGTHTLIFKRKKNKENPKYHLLMSFHWFPPVLGSTPLTR